MPRTTPPRPVDVEALFPEVAAHRRDAVRLTCTHCPDRPYAYRSDCS
ncbi:hypothetical protein OG871_07120 [Kitasatospora sp. NBC_00374]